MKRLLKILRNNENFKWNCCRKVNIKEEWSMNNNLIQAKKDLKAFAKRAKNVKYTESLLFSYLVTGLITFSIGINTSSSVLYERWIKSL